MKSLAEINDRKKLKFFLFRNLFCSEVYPYAIAFVRNQQLDITDDDLRKMIVKMRRKFKRMV